MDDERRFRALFTASYPALRRYAHHRGITGADAEDLVAEVLTVAWRRLDDVPLDDPLPWLFAVARNLRRNGARRSATARLLALRLRWVAQASMPPYEPGEVEAGAIRRALAALGEDDQELLRLIAWDGLTPNQVAVVLGCADATARVRLHRARSRLAAELARRDTKGGPETVRTREPRTEEVRDARRL